MEAVREPGDVILDQITLARARIAREEPFIAQRLLDFEDIRAAQAACLPIIRQQ